MRNGEDWLFDHPEKAYITERYLNCRRSLVNAAFERLATANAADGEVLSDGIFAEEKPERKLNLNTQRLGSVVAALKNHGAKSVIDIGCGEGKLLNMLIKERHITRIAGVDVSHIALERASEKLKLDRSGEHMRERVNLFQGSLTYRDSRFEGFDAACVIEVIEHLDISRLTAFERVLFEFAKPSVIVLTTPNKEYNANYGFLYEDDLRHDDHRFEWTRTEFRDWANKTAERFGYRVQFSEIGDADEQHGAPTQMGVFTVCV